VDARPLTAADKEQTTMAKNWMLVALAGFTMALGIIDQNVGLGVGRTALMLGWISLIVGALSALRAREWVWSAIIALLGPMAVFVYGIYALLEPPAESADAADAPLVSQAQ
jgi:hypothetical protein